MDFSVYLKDQDHQIEAAPHRATRTVVGIVLTARLARKVGQNAIQLTTEAPWGEVKRCARLNIKPIVKRWYVPDRMPPREVPGVFFQIPQSDQWKRDHRTVTFMETHA